MDWAEVTYEVDFLKKCWFGGGVLVSKIIIHFANGVGFGKLHFCRESKKSAKTKMTLTEFKPTFRLILKLFSMIFGRFSV